MKLWLDGDFVDQGPHLSTADRGLLLADGAFETLYVEAGRCAFLPAHIERLKAGLSVLRIAPPPILDEIDLIVSALAVHNGLEGAPGAARITVTRGPGERGLRFSSGKPTIMVSLAPFPQSAPAALTLALSERVRFSRAATARFKALGGYVEHMLAHNEAVDAGADEAVLVNEHGRPVCAAAANLFLVEPGRIVTPPESEGALAGIVRGALLAGAAEIGVEAQERPLRREELAAAQIFLTNSLIGIRPGRLAGAPAAPPAPRIEETFRAVADYYRRLLARELAGARS